MRTSFVAAAALAFLAAMTCPQATAISLQNDPPSGGKLLSKTPGEYEDAMKAERAAKNANAPKTDLSKQLITGSGSDMAFEVPKPSHDPMTGNMVTHPNQAFEDERQRRKNA